MNQPLTVVFAMDPVLCKELFTPDALTRLTRVASYQEGLTLAEFDSESARTALAGAEVLITGWGSPRLTGADVQRMRRLRAVVHAAGSVKEYLSPDFWPADIPVSSAAEANSIPVAEFTIAAILFANKGVLEIAHRYRQTRGDIDWRAAYPQIGNVGKRVGIIGLSRIGRRVVELLAPFDLDVVVHDPLAHLDQVAALGATPMALDELICTSDIVSLHAPALPDTHHLIDARRLAMMRPGATLINTARGSLIDTQALTEAVLAGRVKAILDVTQPDPLPADSPLYQHPGVLLTPHIAGSFGTELRRLGAAAVEEVERLARGEQLAHQVDRWRLGVSA